MFKKLDTSSASSFKTYTFKTVGDLKIDLDVYTPHKTAPKNGYPVFFCIHAGAYSMGSKEMGFTGPQLNEAMNRGWVLVSINYRLVPGAFLQDMVEDIQDAYAWVRTELPKHTPVNPDVITLFGASAGGGLSALSGFKLSPRPKAIIGFSSGFTNWTDPSSVYDPKTPVDPSMVETAKKLSEPVVAEHFPKFHGPTPGSEPGAGPKFGPGGPNFGPGGPNFGPGGPNFGPGGPGAGDPKMALWSAGQKSLKLGWLAVTHDPNLPSEEVLARLKSYSATENVDEKYPPTYLAHGEADNIVPCLHSIQLAEKLKEKNIPHVLDLVLNAGHIIDLNPAFWEKHVLPAFNFAQKYMETEAEK